jgi:DNA adenine methylase
MSSLQKMQKSDIIKLMKLPPPINRVGGKYHLAKKIIPLIPEHKIYVEPFAGAASVFWQKPLAKINVLNDIDTNLMNFFRNLNCSNLAKCVNYINSLTTSELKDFHRNAVTKLKHNNSDFCSMFIASKCGLYGKSSTLTFNSRCVRPPYKRGKKQIKHIGLNALRNCKLYEQKLAHAKIENTDYKHVIAKYDSPHTFFYLDPPYYKITDYYGYDKTNQVHPKEVCDIMKSMQGKAILSYNDHPEVRRA